MKLMAEPGCEPMRNCDRCGSYAVVVMAINSHSGLEDVDCLACGYEHRPQLIGKVSLEPWECVCGWTDVVVNGVDEHGRLWISCEQCRRWIDETDCKRPKRWGQY